MLLLAGSVRRNGAGDDGPTNPTAARGGTGLFGCGVCASWENVFELGERFFGGRKIVRTEWEELRYKLNVI